MPTKIINFMTPGVGVPVLGRNQFGHIVKVPSSSQASGNYGR